MYPLEAALCLATVLLLAACTPEAPVESELARGEEAETAYGVTINRPGPSQHGVLGVEIHSVDGRLEYEIRLEVQLSLEPVEGAEVAGAFTASASVSGSPLDPSGPWFIHLEDEETVWVYDGGDHLSLHTLRRDGFTEDGGPAFFTKLPGMDGESGGYLPRQAPPEVLELLPESLLDRLGEGAGGGH